LQYRAEIDGLRAVAVLPVLVFHSGIGAMTGGYVGVDIFFVISGYLITTIILEEIKQDTFSIINFYERRARRILPALSIVLIATTVAAYIFMPAGLLKSYSQSLASVTTYSSNVFFYLTSGYFSTAADEKPLLHTWSLAVEEQYYLFFPVMVVLLWRFGNRCLASIILVFSTLSLLFSQYLTLNSYDDFNYYLIFSRAWELFSGSLLAIILMREFTIRRSVAEPMSLIGLLLIVYAITAFDRTTPFPGLYALVPVVGTCLIIFFADHQSLVGRLLANKILVFVGLISYSLYLWHQPLFAFLRLKSIGEPSVEIFLVVIAATFALATLSWRYVEKPFRNKTRFSRAAIFKYTAVSMVMFLAIGGAGHLYSGYESRFDLPNYTDSIQHSPKRANCHTVGADYLKPQDACTYFAENISWASFGDSHIVEPAYALAKRLEVINQGMLHLSFSGCSPALLFDVRQPGCASWVSESLDYLESRGDIRNVLLGFRYSYFLFGNQLDAYPELPDISPTTLMNDVPLEHTAAVRNSYWLSMEAIIARLRAAGKRVYVLYPIPELPVPIQKAIMPFSIVGNETMLDLARATKIDYYFKRNEFILARLNTLPFDESLHAIRPLEILCDGNYCPAVKDNKALYFDDHHLSLAGAEYLVGGIELTD